MLYHRAMKWILSLPAMACAAALLATGPGALASTESPPSPGAFPEPQRPVAGIVSPQWGNFATRDAAHEVDQIVQRLGIRPGMTVADIGAGSGYDTLRLARIVGPKGLVIGEDVTADYLVALKAAALIEHVNNVRTVLGGPADPELAAGSIDVAIMVHMYHEIAQPYALLYRLAPAFRRGGKLGIEELDRPTERHGTPPALLVCELTAVGYTMLSLEPLQGALGYFAVFAPPSRKTRPSPEAIRACRG